MKAGLYIESALVKFLDVWDVGGEIFVRDTLQILEKF